MEAPGNDLSRNDGVTLLADESGQAITEYILILSVAVTVGAGVSRAILAGLEKGVLIFGGALEKDLKTGRASLVNWKN